MNVRKMLQAVCNEEGLPRLIKTTSFAPGFLNIKFKNGINVQVVGAGPGFASIYVDDEITCVIEHEKVCAQLLEVGGRVKPTSTFFAPPRHRQPLVHDFNINDPNSRWSI